MSSTNYQMPESDGMTIDVEEAKKPPIWEVEVAPQLAEDPKATEDIENAKKKGKWPVVVKKS